MGPDWKLDRRDSGRLFWRRDSRSSLDPTPTPTPTPSTPSPRERVKFRYDVEVLEFWEHDADDVDDDVSAVGVATPSESTLSSVLVCVGCVAVILATISYQWLDLGWLQR